MIELGRIDMITKLSLLSTHVVLPRKGHLDAAVYIMAHVGQRYNSRLVYDPSYPEIDHNIFKKCDWSEIYRDAKEAISMSAPECWGKGIDINMSVDSDHGGDKVSCISRSDFLIYNTALVLWFSKTHSTVETSVFGTQFVSI